MKGAGQAGQTTTVQLQTPFASTTQAGPPMVLPSGHWKLADLGPGPVHWSVGQVAPGVGLLHAHVGQPWLSRTLPKGQ